MINVFRFLPFTLIIASGTSQAAAAEDRELYKQRLEAQRERQQQVNERNRDINDARSDFRNFTRDIKLDYREQARQMDTELKLRKVDLQADRDAQLADAEAEYQGKVMSVYMAPEESQTPRTPEQLSAETRAHIDKVFSIKKQFAEALQAEVMDIEKKKHALLSEMDQQALDEAASLGLTGTYTPILATPIGGELTRQEERWNEREKKAVAKHEEQNRKLLAEFRNGAKLRQWEMDNLQEDFRLTWEEKAKVHELDAENKIITSMMTSGAAPASQVDRQQWMQQIQQLGAEKRKIATEYRKIKDKNRIERREQRKAILAE